METKVYAADVDQLKDEDLFRRLYQSVLPERREKTDRMVFGKDKRLSLGAGALLEWALREEGLKDFRLTTTANGKPCLAHPGGIYFNLSHSGTRVMCALSDQEIGCDVEQVTEIDLKIARQFFSDEENRALMTCQDKDRRKDLFFRFWTLKESFIKAAGVGLLLPLDQFSIIIDHDRILVRQNLDDRTYYFKEFDLSDGYKYAVCSVDKPVDFLRFSYRKTYYEQK
ncbi:MAG: 4'-phosphopantetheinyl transferase superfamily protein [Eubacterium sp.]|nr:4'-phosphopantetheinyl transferase superfamily protein [Eubacterium sp.]